MVPLDEQLHNFADSCSGLPVMSEYNKKVSDVALTADILVI